MPIHHGYGLCVLLAAEKPDHRPHIMSPRHLDGHIRHWRLLGSSGPHQQTFDSRDLPACLPWGALQATHLEMEHLQ